MKRIMAAIANTIPQIVAAYRKTLYELLDIEKMDYGNHTFRERTYTATFCSKTAKLQRAP